MGLGLRRPCPRLPRQRHRLSAREGLLQGWRGRSPPQGSPLLDVYPQGPSRQSGKPQPTQAGGKARGFYINVFSLFMSTRTCRVRRNPLPPAVTPCRRTRSPVDGTTRIYFEANRGPFKTRGNSEIERAAAR